MHNPSLSQYPRDRRATIIPSKDSVSILDWLRQQGRLIEKAPDPENVISEDDIDDIDDLIGDEDYGDDLDDD